LSSFRYFYGSNFQGKTQLKLIMKNYLPLIFAFFILSLSQAQTDTRIYDIINDVSAERIESDVTTLVNFGTRHTLSDTVSQTRGIGAARRWIKSEFEKISSSGS